MDKDRVAFIEYWANDVKTNPNWKSHHKKFIDSQLTRSNKFYERLLLQKDGVKRVVRITGCKPSLAKRIKGKLHY